MNENYPFENISLSYAYDVLEPYIDTKTMQIHHDKHLQTYIDNLNKALKDYPQFHKLSLQELAFNIDRLPGAIQIAVRNNAGGVYNHRFFFNGMINISKKTPIGNLLDDINKTFGSFENFKTEFTAAAMEVFGSGYAWLVVDKDGKLKIFTTPNQNIVLAEKLKPILNIDVWEHAYYLKNYNLRIDYVNNWYNVINWHVAEDNYNMCK